MKKIKPNENELALLFRQALNFQKQGQYPEAESCYQSILSQLPDHADSLHYLGLVKHLSGYHQSALPYLKKAAKLAPKDADIFFNTGCVFQALHHWQEAVNAYQKAISLKTHYPMAHNNLAICLLQLGNNEGFNKHCQIAYQQEPQNSGIMVNYATYLSSEKRYQHAITLYKYALEKDPACDQAITNLSNNLYQVGYFSEAKHYLLEKVFTPNNLTPNDSTALFLYNYEPSCSAREVFDKHRQWGECVFHGVNNLQRNRYYQTTLDNHSLRIGYVSPDFRNHAVAYFMESIIEAHDKSRYTFFAYSDCKHPDETTVRLLPHFSQWRDVRKLSDAELFQQILSDKIDILIDLAGHSADNRLLVFAKKPAPVQMTYLGYPNTTGLKTMDYRITDPSCDPAGKTDQYHTETLIRLNSGFLCFRPRENCPPVADLPSSSSNHITFASFNNSPKINDEVIAVWAKILHAVPNSRIMLKNKIYADAEIQYHTLQRFSQHGIENERIILHTLIKDDYENLNLYNQVDIALDTFPYNGTTTTAEALWMGVPVVTLVGDTHISRVSYSILSQIGLGQLAAFTIEEYINKVLELTNNPLLLAHTRQQLRGLCQKSVFTDGKKFAQMLESVYAETWRLYQNKTQRIEALCQLPENSTQRQKKADIAVVYHLARTGGTLISRCLACMPGNTLLSEVHPAMSVIDPLIQGQQFFKLFSADEARLLHNSEINYLEKIKIIYGKVYSNNQKLILRDWSHIDFTGRPFIDQPTYQLTQTAILKDAFNVKSIASVRHPLDSYLSLAKLPIMRGQVSIKSYMDGCLQFAKQAKNIGFVRYEDFCRAPQAVIQHMCEALEINYQDDFIDRYSSYEKITGDTINTKQQTAISLEPRRPYDPAILVEMKRFDSYWQTLELLGYSEESA